MTDYLTLARGSMPHVYFEKRKRLVLRVGDPIPSDHPLVAELGGRLVPCGPSSPPPAEEVEPVAVQAPEATDEIKLVTTERQRGGSLFRTVRQEPEDGEGEPE